MRKVTADTLRRTAMALASLLMLVSCSKVKFSAPVVDDRTPLAFDVEWAEVAADDNTPPQSVTVMMSRVKSLVRHYLWNVDGNGGLLSEEIQEPEMLVNGTYMVSGFACGEDGVVLSNFTDFANSSQVLLQDLYVEVPELTDEEFEALDIQDLNPGIPFIRPTGPLYHVTEEDGGLRNIPSGENGIKLKFEQLTCRLGFSLHLAIEEGVVVERVVGVISGLPVKAYLMPGHVDASRTGKMCFEFAAESDADVPTGDCVYSGHVFSLGIMSSKENIVSIGDGVFNGFIKARYEESEELVHEQIFNVSFNLKKAIDDSGLMSKVAKKQELYCINKPEYVFDISTILKITKDNVMSDSEGGFEEWEKDESNDEGLNPEV